MDNELLTSSVYEVFAGYVEYAQKQKANNKEAVSFLNYTLGRY